MPVILPGSVAPPNAPEDASSLSGRAIRSECKASEAPEDISNAITLEEFDSFGHVLAAERFRVLGEAGRGSNGWVYHLSLSLIEDPSYAVKAIPRSLFRLETSMCSECEFVSKYQRLIDLGILRGTLCRTRSIRMDKEFFYIFMEFIGGGHCETGLGDLPVNHDLARHIAQGALKGLQKLHSHNITHCDVSLRNIMTERKRVILVDFDTALLPGTGRHTDIWGALNYTAPEVLESCDYGPASDLWAMGVCLYALLTGRLPFFCVDRRPHNVRNALNAMRRGVRFKGYDNVPEAAKDLIRGLLTFDKHKRTASASAALAHPWLTNTTATDEASLPEPQQQQQQQQQEHPATPSGDTQPGPEDHHQHHRQHDSGDTDETAACTRQTPSEYISPAQPARPDAPLPSPSRLERVEDRPAAGCRVRPSGQASGCPGPHPQTNQRPEDHTRRRWQTSHSSGSHGYRGGGSPLGREHWLAQVDALEEVLYGCGSVDDQLSPV
ncbi:unnamed protein product [Vitrella brassicaformis CCMP3155]|uniref:Protein kinase domain-containing protein n=1 Tax=Vitrella brassicaformis (strain CCMP3155) TaxID=1169540 RepID=A0A0G4H0I2_VITBC|nr:unnamed protein product [Vitrella brassicaformis CCMP3155]|eukprot:CEM36838.1 unnamed protein product [Vitrella brassicaformis CCMP3155]